MSTSVFLAILVTSLATFSSRFLGVITSEKIKENSKIFRWFNCLAYSTLAALIARIIIFPSGVLSEVDYLIRFIVSLFLIEYLLAPLWTLKTTLLNSDKEVDFSVTFGERIVSRILNFFILNPVLK